MFQADLGEVIADIKKMLIPPGQTNPKALYIRADIGMRVYEPTDIRRRSFLHFVLYSPFGGSVHTFVAEQNFDGHEELNELAWENTSNHDTCWRTDGLRSPISKVYFRMADEINAVLVEQGYEGVAPARMDSRASLAWGSEVWKLINVRVKRVPGESYLHHLEIVGK